MQWPPTALLGMFAIMNMVKLNWLLFYGNEIIDPHITARCSGEETLFKFIFVSWMETAHAWDKAIIHTVAYL